MRKHNIAGWDMHRRPEILIVMLTKKCNLSCEYCFVNKKNKETELSEEELKNKISGILSQIPTIKAINFYGGEPLLKYRIIKNLIEYIKKLNKNLNISINTNAILLDKEKANFFKKNDISLTTSLDGDKKTTDLFRKSPDFSSVYDKLSGKIKLLKQIDTTVNMVITPKTCSSLKANFEHLINLGFTRIKFYPDINCNWSKSEIKKFYKNFKSLMNHYLSDYKRYKNVILVDIKHFVKAIHKKSTNICSQIVLSNDGLIYPCSAIPCRTNKIEKEYDIQTERGIDLNKREHILSNIKEKIRAKNKECQNCPIKPFCFCPLDIFFDCKFNNRNFIKRMESLCSLSKAYYEVLSEAKDVLMYKYEEPIKYFEQQPKTNTDKEIYQIWFSITDNCNNRCKYCFVKKEKSCMDFAVIDSGLDLLLKSSGKNKKVIIFGGEPTLYFNVIKELVKLGKRKALLAKKNIEFSIGTNAVEINKEQMNFYKKNDMQVSITIDGKKETHDKYRITKSAKPTYNLIIKNLSVIKSRVKEKNLSCLFGVHYGEVERMLDNFMHIAKELKIPSINIEPIQNHKWTNKEIEIFKYQLVQIFNQLLQDIRKGNFYYINSLNRIIKSKLIKKEGEYPFYKNLVIFSDGNITSNPPFYYINKKYIIGNVNNGIKITNRNQLGGDLNRNIVDFKIVSIRDYFCNKMADYLIKKSKSNKTIKKYIDESIKRIFE